MNGRPWDPMAPGARGLRLPWTGHQRGVRAGMPTRALGLVLTCGPFHQARLPGDRRATQSLGKGRPDPTTWVWRKIRGWSGFGSERPGVERGRRVSGRPPTPDRPGPHVLTRGISHHNKVKEFVAFLMLFGLIYILTW